MTVTEIQIAWCRLLFDVEELERSLRGRPTPPRNDPEREVRKYSERAKDLLGQSLPLLWPATSDRLEVNSRVLTAFLVCKIGEGRLPRGLPADTVLGGAVNEVGIAERVMFCKRLAVAALLAFGVREQNFESLRSLLWLVCEYGHEGLGLDRRIDLEKHLGLAAMEQPALYGLKQFYRDHLNHVIQVCLLGWLLLETKIGNPPQFFWQIVSQRMGNESRERILQQWFMASLLHDVGYVVEVGKGWASLLDMFENSSFSKMRDDVLTAIRSLRDTALGEATWRFKDDDEPEHDHGVASAIHTAELIRSLNEHRLVADLTAAILAMAHHNHWRARIDFGLEPITMWLVMCDEVQEWDRPWLCTDRAGLALSAAVIFPGSRPQQGHDDLSKVLVNLKSQWSNGISSEVSSPGDALEFQIQYTPEIHRQDKIFSAWLGRSAGLQRLQLGNAGFDIRFHLVSGLQPPEGLKHVHPWEPRMERLRRLVREKHLGCVHDWLPKPRVSTPPGVPSAKPGVEYEYSPDGGIEAVRLNTKALAERAPIVGNLDAFWKAAGEWSGSQESREPDA